MMERRTLIAMVLAMALLALNFWVMDRFFPQKPPQKTVAPTPARETPPPAPAPVAAVPAGPVVPPAAAPSPAPPAPRPPQRLATVRTPLYRAVVSSEGGKLQDLTLNYRGEKPMVIVGDLGPAGLLVGDAGAPAEPLPMTLSTEALTVGAAKPASLVLTGETVGLRVRQTLEFSPESYTIAASIRVENTGPAARRVSVELPWASRVTWADAKEKFPGQYPIEMVWSLDGRADRAPHAMTPSLEGIESSPRLDREGDWVAIGSVWYLAALMPKAGGFRLHAAFEKPEAQKDAPQTPAGRATIAVRATPEIRPGQPWEGRVVIYAGPKEYHRLDALGLQDTINFGGFPLPWYWGGLPMRWFGVPILLLMNWVYDYVGNYGIAIILLTIVSKVLFYPLTVKSLRSMKAMQALQPQINALRAKHQKDPQRLQRETMELYRKHGANPLGGCLPMVAQVPIFYALYIALSVAVELQNAAFLCFGTFFGKNLWICDLAAYDPTYVLPILMGITMFVQQKLQPTVGDPRQAKMMLMMPIVFTFMFLNLPSGLVLYWTVSNVLQIAQQKLMDRPARSRATREAKDAGRA